jgi:membrane protein
MTARAFFRRLWSGLVADNVDDLGAMMAFYAVLALFPMMILIVTITVLALPADAISQAIELITPAMPRQAYELIDDQVAQMQHAAVATGFLVGTVLLSVWGASRGASSMMLALDRMLDIEETRPWLKRQGIAIVVTLATALLAVGAMGLLFVGPWIGEWIVEHGGVGDWFQTLWTVARWVGAGTLALGMCVLLYRVLPNWKVRTRDVLPGALVAVALWLLISRGFGLYVDVAGSFDRTYGTLGGVVVFLIWLWLSGMAFLVGAEINQVLAESRKANLAAGRLVRFYRPQGVQQEVELPRRDLGG